MLFPEEDTPHLKKWIVKRLENTSDADADVLADYVLALLRHDGDENSVRALCESEIPDFLKEDTSLFVQDVFEAMQYKSYLPGAPPPPPKHVAPPFLPPNGPSAMMYNGAMGNMNGAQNGSRKRSFHEQAADMGDFGNTQYGNRNFKQPRRGGNFPPGRGGRFDNFENPMRGGRQFQSNPPLQQTPGFPSMQNPLSGMQMDPSDPMATFLALQQAMGLQIPEYDPSNSALMPIVQPSPTNGTGAPPFFNGTWGGMNRDSDRGNESQRGGNESQRGRGNFQQRGDRGRGGNSRRGGRAEFSSDRPNYDRSKTTIVVEQIPEEKFSEENVREFFSAFGNIAEVTMRPWKRLAIVKYDDYNSAKDAYNSPRVIFGNRFVKVYWFVSEDGLPQPPSVGGTNGGPTTNGRHGSANPTATPARDGSEAPIDMEEFAKKQQEAQKVQDEKIKKRLEMEAAKKELELKQEALLKSHEEEKKKLLERLAAKTGKQTKPEDDAAPKENDEVEKLKAVLASKKAEAERLGALGMDSPLSDDTQSWRGRGRGRGAYRGRGYAPYSTSPYVPRGGFRGHDRGGFRGGRGPSHSLGFNLDNRPKKVFLTGIDFTDPEKNESLREYLLGYDTTEVETGFEKSYITFVDRKTAEKFIAATPNGEIPSIGKVEMGWVPNGPLPPVKLPTAGTNELKDTVMGEGDAMAQDESSLRAHATEQQQEVDYDVADDNDWAD